jgi:hypothetical protein
MKHKFENKIFKKSRFQMSKIKISERHNKTT